MADRRSCRSRTNADDRLPRASLGRVEGGDGFVEGRDGADVRPQSSVPHSLDDLTQLGASDSTTKSTARPSTGRASDGPTMDTNVPPAPSGPLEPQGGGHVQTTRDCYRCDYSARRYQ